MNPTIIIVHGIYEYIWKKVNFEYNSKKVNGHEHKDQKVQEINTTSFKRTSLNWRTNTNTKIRLRNITRNIIVIRRIDFVV